MAIGPTTLQLRTTGAGDIAITAQGQELIVHESGVAYLDSTLNRCELTAHSAI